MDRNEWVRMFICMSAAVMFALFINDIALVFFAYYVLG